MKRRPTNTGFYGVSKIKNEKIKKRFVMQFAGRHMGYYATAEEAAREHDKLAKRHLGGVVYLNFPEKV